MMQQIYPTAMTELIRVHRLGLQSYPMVSDIIDFLLGANKETHAGQRQLSSPRCQKP